MGGPKTTKAPAQAGARIALNLRNFPADKREEIRRKAYARGMTIGEFLIALSALHDLLIERRGGSNNAIAAALRDAGLESVTQ